jgi:hypothetical protein
MVELHMMERDATVFWSLELLVQTIRAVRKSKPTVMTMQAGNYHIIFSSSVLPSMPAIPLAASGSFSASPSAVYQV